MMDMNRDWTRFAVDAEIDGFGTGRIVEAHNELRQKAAKLDALIRAMQQDATKYLIPDNECGQDWFVSRMLWHLDGPQQRDAQREDG